MSKTRITEDMLKSIMPLSTTANRRNSIVSLNDTAERYQINNQKRLAAWLATLAQESGELRYKEELASGSAYEGRSDLGNTHTGDGKRFKGRGDIQITGRDNYQRYSDYTGEDFINHPERLASEPWATDSAGWFWSVYRNLNPIADAGDFLTTQIKVNGRNKSTGKPNHWSERQKYYNRALRVIPTDFKLNLGESETTVELATPEPEEVKQVESEVKKDSVVITQTTETPDTQTAVTTLVTETTSEEQEHKESKWDKIWNKWSARLVVIPSTVTAFLGGMWSWITNSPTNVTITIIVCGFTIATIYVILRYIRASSKDKEEARLLNEREKREHELKLAMLQHDNTRND